MFQYGFRKYDDELWIRTHAHFYPPLATEDRFDQIVVPLLANIAKKYDTSPVPDLVTIAPSYWNMGIEEDEWMENRIAQIIRKVGNGWRGSKERQPLILWRASSSLTLFPILGRTMLMLWRG